MSICGKCGGNVIWQREAGRIQCYESDGITAHWDVCSKRRTDVIRETGIEFSEQRNKSMVSGLKTQLRRSGEYLLVIADKAVRGSHSKQSGRCRDCVPPWEMCAECPDKLKITACVEDGLEKRYSRASSATSSSRSCGMRIKT